MPMYQVYVNQGKLTAQQKQDVASAITDGHVARTGAPQYYVQVVIHEIPPENRFVGGRRFGDHMWIRGDVRCRTPEQNKALMLELVDRVHTACGFDRAFIWCDLCSIEATNIVRFNAVCPSAGQEKAWYDALPDAAKDIIQKLLAGDA